MRKKPESEAVLWAILLASLAVPLNLKLGGVLTVYTFDIALAVLYAVWLVRLVRGQAALPRLGVLDYAVWLMLTWFAIAAALGIDFWASANVWLFYLRSCLIYLYVANNLRTAGQVRSCMALLLILLAIEGVVCIVQYATKSNVGSLPDMVGARVDRLRVAVGEGTGLERLLFRTRGTLGYDTTLAHWFELLLPIPVSLWLLSKRGFERFAYAGLTALGFVGLIFTFTRGAWLGLTVAMAVLFLLLWRKIGFTRDYFLGLAQVALLFGVLMFILWKPIRARLLSPEAFTRSAQAREVLNEAAVEMIKSSPLWGVGPGDYAKALPPTDVFCNLLQSLPEVRAHNVYLAVASETGLVGLALFLIFLATAAFELYQVQGKAWAWGAALGRALFAGLYAVLVNGMVDWGLLSYMVLPLFLALLGLGTALRRLTPEVSVAA